MRHLFSLACVVALATLSLGADCGHGGGSPQCPDRSSYEEGPDGGTAPAQDPGSDEPENADINTGGSTGGGGPNCPQQ